ncbi:MAG: glycerophosphoryl diester phosphodiesterase [Candidatus Hydrogenedentota bacterium]
MGVRLGMLIILLAAGAHSVEIVVHRGANEYAPENTMAAGKKCVEFGADYVEVDVRTSADGVFYIMHDNDIARTTDGEGFLHKMTAAQLDTLDAGSWFSDQFKGEPVPRLDAYLDWAKGKIKIYFDVKAADIPALVALVRKKDFENDCFFWFGIPMQARKFREIAPDLALKINANTPEEVRKAKSEYNCQIIECGVNDITPELKEVCGELNIKIMVRAGEKDEAVFREIIKREADMVNLDHPDVFKRLSGEPSPANEAAVP